MSRIIDKVQNVTLANFEPSSSPPHPPHNSSSRRHHCLDIICITVMLTGHVPSTSFSWCSKLPVVLHFQYYLPLVPSLATSVCFLSWYASISLLSVWCLKKKKKSVLFLGLLPCYVSTRLNLFTLLLVPLLPVCPGLSCLCVICSKCVIYSFSSNLSPKLRCVRICKFLSRCIVNQICKSSHHCYLFHMCAYFVLQS